MDTVRPQLSPLQLNSYYIKEFAYSVKQEFVDRQDAAITLKFPRLSADVQDSQAEDDPRQWRFELAITSRDEQSTDFPYSLKIVLVGFFTVLDTWKPERIETLARINAPSVLYSAAREALVTVTSRTGYPALVLPTVFFNPSSASTSGESPEVKSLPPTVNEAEAGKAKAKSTKKKASKKAVKKG